MLTEYDCTCFTTAETLVLQDLLTDLFTDLFTDLCLVGLPGCVQCHLAKSAAAGAKEPTSDEYMTLCRFRKVLNPSTLTTKAARKAAYEAAVRSCPDLPEEEPEQRDVHVLAGFSLSNVDELIQRIKACDIKNCFRLPQTALGRASEQPDYFVERSPPAPPAPSPPAALPSARATNEMAQSVFDSVMELQGEEIYS
jgi:hypothetical protein